MPFIFICIFLIYHLFFILTKKISKTEGFQSLMIYCSISLFYFQSPIITAICEMLDCSQIGEAKYLSKFLTESCTNNPRYFKWLTFMIVPNFLFYAIILPLIFFFYMKYHKSHLFRKDVIYKIGFLLTGFSSEKYYWLHIIFLLFKKINLF